MSLYPSITALFESRALLHPHLPAIQMGRQQLSYQELNEKAGQVAAYLREIEGIKGGYVGICLERSTDLMVAILGILKAGAAYVPFDIDYPLDRLRYMAQNAGIPVMISSATLAPRLPEGDFKVLYINDLKHSTTQPVEEIHEEQAAYVLFTSGSTGQPKGVQMPHRALVNLIEWQIRQTTVHQGGRTLQFAPVSFDVHFQEIFSTWCDGGCLVLISDELRLNAVALLEFLQKEKINRIFLPFIALQSLCEIARQTTVALPELKEIITAGEQLQITSALRDFFTALPHCTLHNHYGPTETHVVTAYRLVGSPKTWTELPPIGKPIDHCAVYVLDEHMQPVADGEEGELYAAGVCLADGYIGRPDLTMERFMENTRRPGERLYKTGDLVKKSRDGQLQYLGRIDGQVKVRGYRIELGEIEIAAGAWEDVQQCAATVREDEHGHKKLVVYLVMKEGSSLNVKNIRQFLQKRLPDYMLPSAFVQLNELPRTPSGKIDRRALPAPDKKRPELGVAYAAPQNELETKMAALWCELLDISPVGIADNLFDLGANSLLALQFVSLMKIRHGDEISVIRIYQYPTIASLSAALQGTNNTENEQKSFVDRAAARNRHFGDDAIAVIGMSLRFPGAESPEEFWSNMVNGVESIRHFSKAELDPSLPADLVNDENYVPARGIMKDAAGFDAAFFNMNPNVAKVTDPQQRNFLELAWNALEHSGYSPDRYTGLIGVFAGVGNNTYYLNNVLPNREAVQRVGSFLAMTQNEKDYIATRVAYELNLKGLAVSVHTACSTSLTAIVQACDALRNHECDMVLAGGASVTSPVYSGQRFEEGAMYSNDGHTRTFDASARGTVFSDGAGIVVLKRYADALADGDTVYALVRGGALNNDGGDKGSFTAPSIDGQASVIGMAQAMAGTRPEDITYIEAHGTATPLGDPIEVEALHKAFRTQTAKKQFCALGSVKTNIGHLTAAAGVAGFIKVVLSLHHKTLPPSLHYTQANPQIHFEDTPFYVNDSLKAWDTDRLPRRAGVSSFGVGGTNAHVILEEAPEAPIGSVSGTRHLIQLSAKTESALENRKRDLKLFLDAHPSLSLADAAFTLQMGRHDFSSRWFAVVKDTEEAKEQLTKGDPKRSGGHILTRQSEGVVFMFPGQGSQYVGMGSTLYRDEIVFRDAVDRCNEILQPLLGRDLREILFAPEDDADAEALLKQTYYTQPALFTIGYSLAQLWMSWGIQPAALIGHSVGEFVAAVISGIFSLEDGLKIVAGRSRLMQECPGGAMLSVRLSEKDILPYLTPEVSIAAVNGPQLCVVAGPFAEVEKIQQAWEQAEIVCKPLHTSHAFHSPMMDPVVEPFAEIVRKIPLHAPAIPIMSTVTNTWLREEEATEPMYWAGHLRATVRFAGGVKALWQDKPGHVLLELGPRNTATTLARQQATDPRMQKAIPSLGDSVKEENEWNYLLSAIGQLWLHGIRIDFDAFHAMEKRKRIALPSYPFEHKEYWLPIITGPDKSKTTSIHTENTPELSDNTTESNMTIATQRKEHLIAEIAEILEEASGMEIHGADQHAGFTEIGLDSLFLTQVALTLTKRYNTRITFRQLNEDLCSLNALAAYIDAQLPAETVSAAPSSPVSSNTTRDKTAAVQSQAMPTISMPPGNESNLQWLITQQLQVMQQQLMMMSGQMPASQPSSTNFQVPVPATKSTAPASADTPFINAEEEKEVKKPFGAVARIEKQQNTQFTAVQQEWMKRFIQEYTEKTKLSKQYTQDHRAHLADPRVVTGFKPHLKEMVYQPVVNRSAGSRIWDIDGNEYIDILNGFGSNMFGHNPEFIVKAIGEQLQKGYELGPQHELAGDVARMVCEMTKFDRAGLCNTGSEAVLGAMRIARTITGRPLIVSFNGAYHGINDEVILRGTKKLKSIPAAAGIMPEAVQNMLVLDYGTPEALAIIRNRAEEIAAVLVEPVQSRRADFQPRAFLQEVRKITEATGSLLIFDEVITGFRAAPGGAQEVFGIRADLGTYGKVVGGGMPIGVIAGKKEFMDALDGGFWQYGDNSVPEAGVTYFAGTFVRHPFALAAADAALRHMLKRGPALQQQLNDHTQRLAEAVNGHCEQLGVPFHIVHFGSLFKPKVDADLNNADLIYFMMRHKGIHMYDGFPCFLTEAHSSEDVDAIVRAFKEVLTELCSLGFLPSQDKAAVKVVAAHTNGNGSHANGNGMPNYDPAHPPVAGALLGKNPDGSPGWFLPDPGRPGKYLKVNMN